MERFVFSILCGFWLCMFMILNGPLLRPLAYGAEEPEIFVQLGHTKYVRSVAFSPDGRYALSGSIDMSLKLWEVATGREVRTFTGHSKGVTSVAFSPHGHYALSGSYDMTLKLWEVATGREVRTFTGHSQYVTSVAFSPDGQYALSGSKDNTLKLWEVATGREVRTFTGHSVRVDQGSFYEWRQGKGVMTRTRHSAGVNSVALSPNGHYALSGGEDKTLKLWDVNTGREVRTFTGHSMGVESVAFSPDGQYALSGGYDKTLKLWDVNTGWLVRTFTGHSDGVLSVAFSPDGRYALSGSGNQTRLWEAATGREVNTFTGHPKPGYRAEFSITSVAFSPDGRYALSGWGSIIDDGTLMLWDVATGEVRIFTGRSSSVRTVAFSPDGRHALFGGLMGPLKLWDVGTGREVRRLSHGRDLGSANSVAFSPDGRYALVNISGSPLTLWEVATGREVWEVRKLMGHFQLTGDASVRSVAFSPDGQYALSGSEDNTMKLWDVATGKEVRTFRGHSGEVTSVAFSPDGRHALSGAYDFDLKLWEVATGREVRTFTRHSKAVFSVAYLGHSSFVSSVAFSPDGRYALSGSSDKTLKLWDVATGMEVRTFTGHSKPVLSVAFSPDGHYALSGSGRDRMKFWGGLWEPKEGSEDNAVKLWEVAAGKEVRTFTGHSKPVLSVAFSPDGRYALSGSNDKTLKLWEVSTGREVRTLTGHSEEVRSVSFSPDGRYALSGSYDKDLKLWEVATGMELRTFTGHSKPVLSVAFSPDGRYALSGSDDKTLKLWEVATGMEVKTLTGHFFGRKPLSIGSVTFSPDSRYALSGGEDETLKLWEVATGGEVRTFTGHSGNVTSVAFCLYPNGLYALSGSADKTMKLWQVSTGREVRTFTGHSAGVTSVAFSPGGRYALSGSTGDSTLKLWEISTGREVWTLTGQSMAVHSVAYSPDGRYILGGSKDKTLKVWERVTGKQVRMVTGHLASVSSATFSPNSRYVLSGSEDGTTRVTDILSGKEVASFISLTDGEWVAITPEGYFNASKNGPSYLNVRMGNRVFGLDQFYDVFYRPDIVEAKLKGEDITMLASTNLEEALKNPPPTVEFVQVPSASSDTRVTIRFKVTGMGGGIGEVRLFHNGKLVQSDGYYREAKGISPEKTTLLAYNSRAIKDELRGVAIAAKREGKVGLMEATSKGNVYEGSITVDAVPGENEIGLAAFNRSNTVQSILKTATFKSALKPEKPHLYILSVGIDEYRSQKDNLKYAVKDAESIARKLKEQSKTQYEPPNIYISTLKNKNATKASIMNRINELAKAIKPADVFVLFIAGHGVLYSGLYSIVTHDYEGVLSHTNLIGSNEIMEISKNMKALTQVFILDTCHAGGLDNFVSGLYDARMTVLARNMGLHMYASASSTQEALDGYKGVNGMFTYMLLDGLSNNRDTDLNKDTKVSVYELGAYAKDQTVKYSKEMGHRQTPVIKNFGKDITVYMIR